MDSINAARQRRRCAFYLFISASIIALTLTACTHARNEAHTDGPAPRDANGNPVLTNFEH